MTMGQQAAIVEELEAELVGLDARIEEAAPSRGTPRSS